MAEKTQEQKRQEEEQKRQEEQKKQEEQRKRQEEQQRQQNPRPGQQPGQPGQHQTRSAGGSTGKISTYSATQGGPQLAQDPRGPERVLSTEEIRTVADDLMPGELAFVKLNEEGTPEGAAFRDIPDQDAVVARVYASPKAAFDDVVTPSGAPLTKFMNPDPQLWDEGMRLRNPVPKEDRNKGSQYKVPAGGGVINQPVTT